MKALIVSMALLLGMGTANATVVEEVGPGTGITTGATIGLSLVVGGIAMLALNDHVPLCNKPDKKVPVRGSTNMYSVVPGC
jgi:hypothetical protein